MQTAVENQQLPEGKIKKSQRTTSGKSNRNVGSTERIASAIGGGVITAYGLKHGGWTGVLLALAGGAFVKRGVTGYCEVYDALGVDGAKEKNENVSVEGGAGVKVEESVMIEKSPEELYRFWRDFENLPQVMSHLKRVETSGAGNKSHWVAKAPLGQTIEWDAEIITDHPGEMIAWRSLEKSEVANAGSVHFTPAVNGTRVRVVLKYDPPGGKIGAMVAKLFGEEPERQIADDLGRFKRLMESNEFAQKAKIA